MEEGPLSFMQFNPACLVLLVLGISLLDYMVNTLSAEQKVTRTTSIYSASAFARHQRIYRNRSDDETPLARYCGLRHLQLRHRVKVLAGVKRRIDQEF
ncbi:hypothetical protein KR054_008887 [Drosophila jambulina]|nr:hypothetical protein KR054_008887 [Drosophila jambulina]